MGTTRENYKPCSLHTISHVSTERLGNDRAAHYLLRALWLATWNHALGVMLQCIAAGPSHYLLWFSAMSKDHSGSYE